MRIILFILLLSLNVNAQTNININGSGTTVSINGVGTGLTINQGTVSYVKNVQRVEEVSTYDAFGHLQRTGDDRATYFYRSGTSHLLNGVIKGRHYTISTDSWGEAFTIYTDPSGLDMRDVWGGIMDNDSIALFSCASEYSGTGTPLTSHAFVIKGDLSMNFGDTQSIFKYDIPQLQRGLPFGYMQYGGTPGTYFIPFWQFNGADSGTVDEPIFPRYRIVLLKTTDYWNTWTYTDIYNGAFAFTESSLARFSDGRMALMTRTEGGSPLRFFESSDDGVTWTYRNFTNLGYAASLVTIPFSHLNTSGLLDVFYQDRNNGWITTSRNNDPDDFFGGDTFNTPDLYYYNRFGSSGSETYRLGYPSTIEIEAGKYLVAFARQESTSKANIWYTKDDFVKTEIPATPPLITVSSITTTSALVTCDMYFTSGITQEESENIQYFEVDASTASDFSTFVTGKLKSASEADQVINEVRNEAHYVAIYGLTTATTYYVRMRAVNDIGASDWITTNFTTL